MRSIVRRKRARCRHNNQYSIHKKTENMKTTASKNGTRSSTRSSASKQSNKSSKGDEAQGLRDLFEDQLKDIYWAEKALTKAIPKMIKKASSEELVNALTEHLAVTEEQVTRVEEVFAAIDVKATAKKCDAM